MDRTPPANNDSPRLKGKAFIAGAGIAVLLIAGSAVLWKQWNRTRIPDQATKPAPASRRGPGRNDASRSTTESGDASQAATEPDDAVAHRHIKPPIPPRELTFEEKLAAAKNSTVALRLLQGRHEAVMANSKGEELKQLLALATDLISRWPDSSEAISAHLLKVKIYRQLGDREKEKVAFFLYSEATGRHAEKAALASGENHSSAKSKGIKSAAEVIRKEADRLVSKKEYLVAVDYNKELTTRYPNTPIAHLAQFQLGRCYRKLRLNDTAVKAYEAVLAQDVSPDLYARSAQSLVSTLSSNSMKDYDKAESILLQWAAKYPSKRLKAYVLIKQGTLEYDRGESHFPQAIRKFNELLTKYPKDPLAGSARQMLDRIKSRQQDGPKLKAEEPTVEKAP